MSTGMETITAAEWIALALDDVTLAGLCPGGVHEAPAKAGTAFPHVTFTVQAATDAYVVGDARIHTAVIMQVRVVGRDVPTAGLRTAAARIDTLLKTRTGTVVSTGRVHACVRQSAVHFTATTDGVTDRFLGGLYRVLVS